MGSTNDPSETIAATRVSFLSGKRVIKYKRGGVRAKILIQGMCIRATVLVQVKKNQSILSGEYGQNLHQNYHPLYIWKDNQLNNRYFQCDCSFILCERIDLEQITIDWVQL